MRRFYLLSGRVASPFFVLGLRLFTLITRTPRVRVIVLSENGQILLLRGVISDGKWSLPGGGVSRGETLAAAARRELHEETGIDVEEKALHYITTLEKSDSEASYRAPLFIVRAKQSDLPTVPVNLWEIAAVRWCDLNDLPSPLSPLTKVVLSKYKSEF